MRYRLQSLDHLRACLGRIPDDVRVEVERGVAVSAETVADLRSLSALPPGLVLVFHRALPDLQRMKLCHSVAASSASRSVFAWCDKPAF